MRTRFCSDHIDFVDLSEDLVSAYLEMVNDIENVAQYLGDRRTPYTREEELEFVRGKIDERAVIFSMIERESGAFIGNIEFMDVKDACAELGIAITAKMQNRHYGSEAIARMLQYGFGKLNLERVFLKVFPQNTRAIHVYEKCGFRRYNETDTDVYMEIVTEEAGTLS